jgi:hypothetical protein
MTSAEDEIRGEIESLRGELDVAGRNIARLSAKLNVLENSFAKLVKDRPSSGSKLPES